MGGEYGFTDPDEKTAESIRQCTNEPFEVIASDPGCGYKRVLSSSISDLEPQITASPTLDNVKPVEGFDGRPIQ